MSEGSGGGFGFGGSEEEEMVVAFGGGIAGVDCSSRPSAPAMATPSMPLSPARQREAAREARRGVSSGRE